MAIFHLSVKTFSRSKGQSATASVAYRAGAKIECEREGRTHDYTKKGGVLHSEIFLPDNAPDWANDRQKLWNEAEKAEKRKNSTVAREFEVALPYELNEKQRIALVQDFAKQIVERHGCAVDAHLHDDDRRTVKANHHAHIMLTTRKIEENGFTNKTRELDQKQSGEVVYWREQWAKAVNTHLRACGIEKVVDHRSLREQGLERQPTIKLGVNAASLERKGVKTDKGEYNRAITAYNPDKLNEHLTVQFKQAKELHNKLNFIKKRIPEVKRDIAEKQPKLYKAFDDMGIPTAPDERMIESEQPTEQAEPVSPGMVRSPSVESNSNERGRELSPVGDSKSNELGQTHTSEVEQTDSSTTSISLKDNLKAELTGLSINAKRKLLKAFNNHIDQEAEKLLNDKLKQIREQAKPQLEKINELRGNKPLNPFKIKAWKKDIDKKVEQYNKIKVHYDQLKANGVTKEHRTQALRDYYLERPEAYNSMIDIQKELKEQDQQRPAELEQQRVEARSMGQPQDKGISR